MRTDETARRSLEGTGVIAKKATIAFSFLVSRTAGFMKPEFTPKVAQNQRTYRRNKRRDGPGQARGERISGAVLTEDLVRSIRAMRQGLGLGATRIQAVLAEDGIKVNSRTIGNVIGNRTWGWVR